MHGKEVKVKEQGQHTPRSGEDYLSALKQRWYKKLSTSYITARSHPHQSSIQMHLQSRKDVDFRKYTTISIYKCP